MTSDDSEWTKLKKNLMIGTVLEGTVIEHFPFGFFLDFFTIEFKGLVQVTDIKDIGKVTTPEYPKIGSVINAVVLGFKDNGQQIWMGIKPSQLNEN